MKGALTFAAIGEVATGLTLLVVPSLVGRWLFGEDLTGVALPIARVAGIALIGLGVACWPGTPLVGMLIYSAAVTLYLAYLGLADGLTGLLLWPAVVLHASLTALLTLAITKGEEIKT
ncbi:MAG: hypothetical protein IPK02_09360 [Candidatus Accumulibacter sp.]|jgi:hypothetical protein|uniref:Uncharacterized protein n=1 Tax=Candidatus Accumulibacter affinis TaxID=2954384 RepID=A0A935TA21_9PROT|nr:hypothetical protein [Candidatus Accumulibacter affinis]